MGQTGKESTAPEERVGCRFTLPLAFEYAQAWLDRKDVFPRSVIALQAGRIASAQAHAYFDGKTPLLPEGSAPTTHILKPDIRRMARVRESAANEAIIMRAAAHCGLHTASGFYQPQTRSCIVGRFASMRRPAIYRRTSATTYLHGVPSGL